jgi:hypothetical protein
MPEAMTVQEPPASGRASCSHDVFISYNPQVKDWVCGELVPHLEAANLKTLFDERFLPGSVLLDEIERAVDGSRYTLVVLTPAWIQSQWNEFEGSLVATADPAGRQRKLIPLVLEKCPLPRRIARLVCADFTSPASRKEEMARLVRALKAGAAGDEVRETLAGRGLPLVQQHISQFARDGLQALAELAGAPEVRAGVIHFGAVFRVACEQIEILGDYKDVHDSLHKLQLHCYNPIAQDLLGRFPSDESARDQLADHELTLQGLIDRLGDVARRATFVAKEMAWIQDLVRAGEELRGALDQDDKKRLHKAQWLMSRVLGVQPTQVNTRLNAAARNLRLPALQEAMASIRANLSGLDLDRQKTRQFGEGVEALDDLNRGLSGMISDHDSWQAIDVELRRIEVNVDQIVEEFELTWPYLKERAEPLYRGSVDAWALALQGDAARLEKALAAQDPRKLAQAFQHYRRRVLERFYRVDVNLKELCSSLRKIGEPLAAVLRIIA